MMGTTGSHLPLCPSSQPLTSRAPSTSCSGDYHDDNHDDDDPHHKDYHDNHQNHILDEEGCDGD